MSTAKPIIFLTGQNGMLGQFLSHALADKYQIVGLTRDRQSASTPRWNYSPMLKQLKIKAPHAVIHLAGAGIADKRWTAKYKRIISGSRTAGTQWLVGEMMIHDDLPETFVCASAIGYYGHRPGEALTETSEGGDNFVAKVASYWEHACQRLDKTNVRVANLRSGMILSPSGGALKSMILPFKLGLGGRLGNGQQIYSWIAIDDAAKAIQFILENKPMNGPINLTSPNPVSNKVFTATLADVLERPAFMHMPKMLVRLLFGGVANELLLADAAVQPAKLQAAGFEFDYPKLKPALQHLLK